MATEPSVSISQSMDQTDPTITHNNRTDHIAETHSSPMYDHSTNTKDSKDHTSIVNQADSAINNGEIVPNATSLTSDLLDEPNGVSEFGSMKHTDNCNEVKISVGDSNVPDRPHLGTNGSVIPINSTGDATNLFNQPNSVSEFGSMKHTDNCNEVNTSVGNSDVRDRPHSGTNGSVIPINTTGDATNLFNQPNSVSDNEFGSMKRTDNCNEVKNSVGNSNFPDRPHSGTNGSVAPINTTGDATDRGVAGTSINTTHVNFVGGEDLSVNTWQKISILVCAFVVLREFHPIEPYFVKYLETINPEYTWDVVKRSIYPVGTYSSLLLMIITFLITDYTRYKPIVVLDVVAGLLSYVLILNNPSMTVMWVQQVCIGFYHAGEVSYYSYMYSKIKDKTHYQRATGRVKASIMIGRFLSGITGQGVVLLFDMAGYKYLVYLSMLGMTAATLWTCLLPPVEDSVYFHNQPSLPNETSHLQPRQNRGLSNVVKTIWADFQIAFSQVEIIKWSVWWIMGMCGYILVITYNQVLWSKLVKEDPIHNKLMNGAVDAVFTVAGAISTFTIGRVSLEWSRWGELMLAVGTLIQGSLLVITSVSLSLRLVYLYHIVFGCIHYTMLTIASSEIAKHLKRESFALVFGFNKFVALLCVSVFTLYKVQLQDTPTRTLYLMFGLYFVSIGIVYFSVCLYRTVRTICLLRS